MSESQLHYLHLEVGELFEVIVVVHAVVAQGVAVISDFGYEGVGHRLRVWKGVGGRRA